MSSPTRFLERARGTLGLPAHREHYDDLGEVRGRVVDLAQAVARHREARIFVERGEADLELVTPLPVPARSPGSTTSILASACAGSSTRARSRRRPNAAGRAGVGWESHCDHGAYTLVHRAVDWRPFDYLTLDSTLVIRGPITLPRIRTTFEFSEDGPTRVSSCTRVRARDRGLIDRMKIPLAAAVFRRQFRTHYEVLARVLAEDAAAWQAQPETEATKA